MTDESRPLTEVAPRLAHALADRYRIECALGQGGMATVYLAEDLKHDRRVALKVLKPELAAVLGAERFVQEIKTTAALSHPHILPLFDSGSADGQLYYVMPYIKGETIREKLSRDTQFGISEAVGIAAEVADALDYAHRHGVVHRDIKPENILLHDGRPMVMDFGIALAVSAAAGGRMTETGLSLGTPHYMSPEQATADKEISGRSDIYSLGSVLYEMLTGEPPHTGGSAQQVIMKIVTEDAQPVTRLRRSVPPNVAAAVSKALEKLPADRFESARGFADALSNPHFTVVAGGAVSGGLAGRGRNRWRGVAFAALGASVVLLAAALWGWLRSRPAPPMTEREIVLGSLGTVPGTLAVGTALAPDGSAIAYVDTTAAGDYQLMLKERDRLAPRVLAHLTGPNPGPTFSPDGRSIAFADGKLFRVPRSGGAPVVLSDSAVQAVTWSDKGTIVSFALGGQALYATASAGGPTRRVIKLNGADGVFGTVGAIAGANAVVVTVIGPDARAMVLDLKTGQTHDIQAGAVGAWVVGHWLVYVNGGGVLFGAPFDPSRRVLSGAPTALRDSIQMYQLDGSADAVIGADGTLLYVKRSPMAGTDGSHLARVATDGSAELLDSARTLRMAGLGGIDLSPDGRRVAVNLTDSASGRSDIYVLPVQGGTPTRLTFTGTINIRPAWSPDGRRIMYVSNAGGGALRLWAKAVDGGEVPVLLSSRRGIYGGEWSPDGHWIVYRTDAGVTGNRDILAIATTGDTTPVPLAATPANELAPAVSPDSRWLAYSSNVNGVNQIFVQPFPQASGAIWQVSSRNGVAPRWSHDGHRLFYQTQQGRMMVADVSTSPTFAVLRERTLFSSTGYLDYIYYHAYAVDPDDQHLIMVALPPSALGRGARVVEVDNWLPAAMRAGHE